MVNSCLMRHPADDVPYANMTLDHVISIFVRYQLSRHKGNRTHTAAALGISVRTLRNYMTKWRFDIEFPSPYPNRRLPKPKSERTS